MNIDVIGNNAGLVWTVLSEKNSLPVKALKKVTKLKDKEIYAAMGWLAREGKITFEETEEDLLVTLL